jgi:hypothetical protein
MDKHNRDHKKNNKDVKKPVNKNPQFTPAKSSDKKPQGKKA